MKTHLLLALLLCSTSILAQSEFQSKERYSRIAIPDPDAATVQKILSVGIDLHCGSRKTIHEGMTILEIECSARELNSLTENGVQHSILIKDVEDFYEQRANSSLSQAKASLDRQKDKSASRSIDSPEYTVPEHFILGDLGGFLYYDQILHMLDSMADLYPELITIRRPLSDTLRTHEGREVFWVRISDHAPMDEPEPEVLYTALTHAREPASVMSMLFYMWYLLENYEMEDEIRKMVDHTEMYFIPVVNPDGYVYNQTIAPQGGGMWRKNVHDNNGNEIIDDQDGVDLNRNYGYLWGYDNLGSSPNPAISTYRGEAAFSEPETQMIRDFTLQREFITAMHDHTYGNDLYHAWEHGASPLPDAPQLYRLSDLMTWNNRYLFGQSYNTYWLGEINGGANDWFYGEQTEKPKIFCWLAEIGPSFWPDPLDIVEICRQQMEPHLMVARIAGQHARIHDLNISGCTYGDNTLQFRIENLGLRQGDFKLSLIPSGEGISDFSIQNDGVVSFDGITQTRDIRIELTIDTRVGDGSFIAFDLLLEGEEYLVDQMHLSLLVNPQLELHENAKALLASWETEQWGTVQDEHDADATWITDSPSGNQLNAFNTITLRDPLSLQDVSWAKATFQAQWSVESTYDFVQIQARAPHGDWIALQGRYTKPGAIGYLIDIPSPFAGQPVGKPVYDGRQLVWVQEEVDLSDFLGRESIELRFVAWSGGTVSLIEEDGFYFKDFRIYTSRKLHCMDNIQNADEEDVDCGGNNCPICITCEDGILNGNEEGVDCGGNCDVCATCVDGIQNADETGVDCGGSGCIPCATCEDGIQNGTETGIDCGGSCTICVPTCHDGILNGDEENVDCGGSCPDVCKTYCCEKESRIWYNGQILRMSIAPNPVKDQLAITIRSKEAIDQEMSVSWDIIDLNGVHIDHGQINMVGETVIDVSRLVPRMYIIHLLDGQGMVSVQRFLKG